MLIQGVQNQIDTFPASAYKGFCFDHGENNV